MVKSNLLQIVLLVLVVCVSTKGMAQLSHGSAPLHWNTSQSLDVEWMEFSIRLTLDHALRARRPVATAKFKDAPWRFGIEHPVAWNTSRRSGAWSHERELRFDVWRLGVQGGIAPRAGAFTCPNFDSPEGR